MFEWDEATRKRNLAKHGVDFASIDDMDWANALRITDDRRIYGETRYVALGRIEERLHVCVYTERAGRMRIISLRKANRREEKLYEEKAFDE